ncbi:MAG TPA: hypothetical protein PLO61_11405 [Fimbriimonadaceae bacterium]|nr:hypothetical protein [Fimbriimonadaceae bacterium]
MKIETFSAVFFLGLWSALGCQSATKSYQDSSVEARITSVNVSFDRSGPFITTEVSLTPLRGDPFVFADHSTFLRWKYRDAKGDLHDFRQVGQSLKFDPEYMTRIPPNSTLTFRIAQLVYDSDWKLAKILVIVIEPIPVWHGKGPHPVYAQPFTRGLIQKPVTLEYPL